MNEEAKVPESQPASPPEAEAPAPETAPEGPPPAPQPPSQEVEEGKAFAILSYALSIIGLPFFLVPLIMRNNEFSLYHAKQCLMIWLLAVVGGVVSAILSLICIGFILGAALAVFVLVLTIIGIINAANGEQKPLILIGKWGEDWFKGITKA